MGSKGRFLGKLGGWFLLFASLQAYGVCDSELAGEAAKAILIKKCGVCHRGPFLDMSRYPFSSSDFNPEPILFEEFIVRIEKEGFGVMPPVNGVPLTEDEKTTVLQWLRGQ